MDILVVILLVRLSTALLAFKWPFAGFVASIVADSLDYIVFDLTIGIPANYQLFDKTLDLYTMAILFVVSLKYSTKLQWFFAHRAIGVIIFLLTQKSIILLLFPDFFQIMYFVKTAKFIRLSRLVVILLCILKIAQEAAIHAYGLDIWSLLVH